MARPDLDGFAARLAGQGVSRRVAMRMEEELADHYEDLVEHAVADGMSRRDAEAAAGEDLGDLDAIRDVAAARPELGDWMKRHPGAAALLLPAVWAVAMPVARGVEAAPVVGRWLICAVTSASITAAMMLVLTMTILPG